jgi:putative adenylate-forming enzyme
MSADPTFGDSLQKALAFGRDRWCMSFRSRAHLELWQQQRLAEFIRGTLPNARRYRGLGGALLGELPYMDKALMMSDFEGFNTRGVTLKEASEVALRAEDTRNFKPSLGDLTVGMSSGTSGTPGVFLVSKSERQRWAGVALARALPSHLLKALLSPWRAPLRIAFFLRANSNLYTSLQSRRLHFGFHDLLQPLEASFPALAAAPPDLLVAPASILKALAEARLAGRTALQPGHIISVAEVLEPSDAALIEKAFQRRPHQIYQATEGFLGFTCEAGTLHLNEAHVHVEADWLDDNKTRFQPVITDFSRETQMIVRYRLNDILTPANPCSCGRPETAISAVAGRADEVLLLSSLREQSPTRVFPDVLRRAMMLAGPALHEYRITQRDAVWEVEVLILGEEAATLRRIQDSIGALCRGLGAVPPQLRFGAWHPGAQGAKRQRINRLALPHAP